jgi:hypothetical protein
MTPSGIEIAALPIVAQCLNHLRHRVPRFFVLVLYFHTWCKVMGVKIKYRSPCSRHEGVLGSRSITPLILNFGTGWWCVVSFTHGPQETSLRYYICVDIVLGLLEPVILGLFLVFLLGRSVYVQSCIYRNVNNVFRTISPE